MDQTAAGDMSAVMDQDKNIDAMYKELQILKGSIKKLMIDIREEMSNAENPFLNLQQLQAPPAGREMRNMEAPEEISEMVAQDELEAAEAAAPVKKPEAPKKPSPKAPKAPPEPAFDEEEEIEPETEPYDIDVPKMLLRQMKDAMRESEADMPRGDEGRLDPDTVIKLMQWTRTVLAKNGTVRFHNLLDAYVTMGYLSAETKGIVEKMSLLVASDMEQVPKDIDIKECVGDMYTLFMILNPGDKSLDSKMLGIMLGHEDRTLNTL